MTKFSQRLKELRVGRGISQQKLADDIDTSKSSINMYERGEREPGIEMLEAFADYFNVDMDYLVGKTDIPNRYTYSAISNIDNKIIFPKMKKVPLLGKTACGEPIYRPNLDDGYALIGEEFTVDFALEAVGDSMIDAGIHDGDIVYFVAQEMVDNGQIAAVFVNGETMLKRVYYYRERNELVLQSANPSYDPFFYRDAELDNIRIVGRAVAHLRKL